MSVKDIFEYLLIALLVFVAIKVYYFVALKIKIIDVPNFRSSHSIPTVRGGGIIFLVCILTYYFCYGFSDINFLLGIILIAIVSFIDDIYSLKPNIRILVQCLGIYLIFAGLDAHFSVYTIPILIFSLFFINVYNFMDGINGITILYSLVSLITITFLEFKCNLGFINIKLLVYLIIANLILGYFNFRIKALIFLGDIGSLTLATIFIYFLVSIIFEFKNPIIILVFSVYMVDGGLTILRRIFLRENVTTPHRKHIYQQLVDFKKYNHLKIAALYGMLQGLINLLVFIFWNHSLEIQFAIIIMVLLFLAVIYFYFVFVAFSKNSTA